jgi:hypothetical protein
LKRRADALAAIRGVWGEFGESLESILTQRSRFDRNARFALVLDVADATIDRVNEFPKVTFQRGLCECGVREVDHRLSGNSLARPARCECLKLHSHARQAVHS